MNGYKKIVGINLDYSQTILLDEALDEHLFGVPPSAEPNVVYVINDHDYDEAYAYGARSVVITTYPSSGFSSQPLGFLPRMFDANRAIEYLKSFCPQRNRENARMEVAKAAGEVAEAAVKESVREASGQAFDEKQKIA